MREGGGAPYLHRYVTSPYLKMWPHGLPRAAGLYSLPSTAPCAADNFHAWSVASVGLPFGKKSLMLSGLPPASPWKSSRRRLSSASLV